jgi:hypothetical protein
MGGKVSGFGLGERVEPVAGCGSEGIFDIAESFTDLSQQFRGKRECCAVPLARSTLLHPNEILAFSATAPWVRRRRALEPGLSLVAQLSCAVLALGHLRWAENRAESRRAKAPPTGRAKLRRLRARGAQWLPIRRLNCW